MRKPNISIFFVSMNLHPKIFFVGPKSLMLSIKQFWTFGAYHLLCHPHKRRSSRAFNYWIRALLDQHANQILLLFKALRLEHIYFLFKLSMKENNIFSFTLINYFTLNFSIFYFVVMSSKLAYALFAMKNIVY